MDGIKEEGDGAMEEGVEGGGGDGKGYWCRGRRVIERRAVKLRRMRDERVCWLECREEGAGRERRVGCMREECGGWEEVGC